MKLYAPSTIQAIKEKHNFQLSRSLGQNFITDKNVIEEIVRGAGVSEKDLVIEIGPGNRSTHRRGGRGGGKGCGCGDRQKAYSHTG